MKITQTIEDELKDYDFPFEKLATKFIKMAEKEKIVFCNELKSAWNRSIGAVYEDVKREFFEDLSCRAKTMEEINALRQGLAIFILWEKQIRFYINYFENKSKGQNQENIIKNL